MSIVFSSIYIGAPYLILGSKNYGKVAARESSLGMHRFRGRIFVKDLVAFVLLLVCFEIFIDDISVLKDLCDSS